MPPSPFATASQLKESSLIYQQSWWRMQQRLLAWDENKNKKKSEQSIMLPAFNTQWMPFHQHHSSSSKGSSKGSTTTTTMPMASVNLPVFFCCSDYSFFHHHQKHTGCYHHHNFGLENSNKNHYHATGYGPPKAPCYTYHSQNTKKTASKGGGWGRYHNYTINKERKTSATNTDHFYHNKKEKAGKKEKTNNNNKTSNELADKMRQFDAMCCINSIFELPDLAICFRSSI